MDIYHRATDLLLDLPAARAWPEMQEMFEHARSKAPRDWRLPVIACQAAGGEVEQALPAVGAVACIQMSVILIDDLLDNDPRGVYHRIGAAETANLAAALQAAGLEVVARCKANRSKKLAAMSRLNRVVLTTALGQKMDIQNPDNEEAYWNLVRTKSSPFFGAALFAGAILGGAETRLAEAIERFGWIYGEMIQIHDDLNDTMAIPAGPDWVLGRSPLPILFAQTVPHADRERFLELRRNPTDAEALREAQTILIRCGAISYGIHQLLDKHRLARELVRSAAFKDRSGLENLMEDVIQPVMKMFAAIGIEHPERMLEPHGMRG